MYFIISLLQAHALSPDDFGIRMDGEVLTQGNLSFDTSFQRDGYQSFSYPTAVRYGFAPKWELQLGSNVALQQTGVFLAQGLYSQILYKAIKGHSFLPSTALMLSGAPNNLTLPISHFALLWTGLPQKMIFYLPILVSLGMKMPIWILQEPSKMDTVQISILVMIMPFFPFNTSWIYIWPLESKHLYMTPHNFQFTILTEFAYQVGDIWNVGFTTQSYPKTDSMLLL